MLPEALNGHGSPDEGNLSIRAISMEEEFRLQNGRIAYLRSVGQPWAEAVYEARDMLVGLEDEEFWDGMPSHIRKQVVAMEDAAAVATEARERRVLLREAGELRAKWAREGWLGMPIRAFRTAGGGTVYRPTAENLSHALRIVRRLATRQGIMWRKKRTSRLSYGDADED